MKRLTDFFVKIYTEIKKNPLRETAALLLLTGAVHLWAFTWAPVISRDAIAYLAAAARWAENGVYDYFYFPPLTCFLIKLFIQMGFSPETAGHIYSFLTGLFIPAAAYIFALATTGNRRLARYTAIMLIGHPLLVFFSVEPLRDGLYVLLTLLLLTAGVTGLKTQKLGPWILCGVLTAAAWCCRFEALEFTALAFLALLILVIQKRYSFVKAVCHFLLYLFLCGTFWALITFAAGGRECFKYQYDNYILNKWNLFVQRWKR